MIAQIDSDYIKARPYKLYSRLVSYFLFEGRPVTTRGQWINPFIMWMMSLSSKIPFQGGIKKPVFIIGTGRSGTTILGKVLSMHKDVGYLNEPKALWHLVYPDEDMIGSYSMGPASVRLGADDVKAKTRAKITSIYRFYQHVSLSKRVVDKYPELVYRVDFVRQLFPDAKFLFLIRNGVDTCSSIRNWSAKHGESLKGGTHDWWGVNNRKWNLLADQVIVNDAEMKADYSHLKALDNHLDKAAIEWVLAMKEGMHFSGLYPDSVLPVRYEELVANPDVILAQILSFCELPHDAKFVEYGVNSLRPSENRYCPPELDTIVARHFTATMEKLSYQ